MGKVNIGKGARWAIRQGLGTKRGQQVIELLESIPAESVEAGVAFLVQFVPASGVWVERLDLGWLASWAIRQTFGSRLGAQIVGVLQLLEAHDLERVTRAIRRAWA